MIRFDQNELDRLAKSLRQQPGFIIAAVVPAGSGDALIERLHAELEDLKLEVATPAERPIDLGSRAAELGAGQDQYVFILRLDEPGLFASEEDAVEFWRGLNYQREALGAGTVRTLLLLNTETELGLALIADDLWDWATIFRFPEATRAAVRTPADSGALVWAELPTVSDDELAILRGQWRRARRARLPSADLVENYAVPLFLALPASEGAEAIQLWKSDLERGEAVGRLPPAARLSVAGKMIALAGLEGLEPYREALTRGALRAADGAVATLTRKAADHPEAFEPELASALSASARIHQAAGRFEVALDRLDHCLELLGRLEEPNGGGEDTIRAHLVRRWALAFLLQARADSDLPLPKRVDRLRAMDAPALDPRARSDALGAALEISLTQSGEQTPQANAALLAAWVLSDDARLVGPRFEEVLARDPAGYCQGLDAIWQTTVSHQPWEKLLVDPLTRQRSTREPASAAVREALAGWLRHRLRQEARSGSDS